MTASQIIEADLTWTGARFERGVRIAIDGDRRIDRVGALTDVPTIRLANQAILPGFINAHSHAFQRGLRGRGERFPGEAGSFWTWREAMYALVEQMNESMIYELSHRAFGEMRAAGITTVGEFHYLHHDSSCEGFVFDEVVLRAARDAGIRIALLSAYYRTGGFDQPLAGGQQRFGTPSIGAYWEQIDRLRELLNPAMQSLGIVAHSIRAATIDEIASLHEEAERRGLPFHMHIEEQPREIEECVRHYGKTPMALLIEHGIVTPRVTCVHCTHTAEADLDEFIARGGNICVCPLTEANLGDGLANVPRMLGQGGHICLGTDSNARISMLEEMRWLEYGQRLALQSRGVCRDDDGQVAPTLLSAATTNGARSLGLKAGRIEPGHHADFVTVDLNHPTLAGWDDETLVESLIFGTSDEMICATCVNGRWVNHRDRRAHREGIGMDSDAASGAN